MDNQVTKHNFPTEMVDLPSKGLLYPEDSPLRSGQIEMKYMTAKEEDILKNEEINTMIHTIGAGVGSNFMVSDSNYDKIIIMTDADVDGAHIQILLLTFFYRFMKPLIEEGHLYIAMPPLYKVDYGKKYEYL